MADQTAESPLIGRKQASEAPTQTNVEIQRLINRRARFTVAICACGMAVLAFVFVMRKSRTTPHHGHTHAHAASAPVLGRSLAYHN